MGHRPENDRNMEIIDETNSCDDSYEKYKPSLMSTPYKLKAFVDISRLFIIASFILLLVISLIGLHDKDFAENLFIAIWEKIAYVYLVIFGSVLGRSSKE